MKKLFALLLVPLLAFSLVACRMDEPVSNPTPAGGSTVKTDGADAVKKVEDITIAYVCSVLTNEIFSMQVAEMERYTKELGCKFLYTQCEDDAARISAVENYTQLNVDVMIIHVQSVDAVQPAIEAAQAKGIKIFSYDTDTPTSDAYWGCKNYDYGYITATAAANWIVETFGKDEHVAVALMNWPTAEFIVERENGIRAALADIAPNTEVVATYAGGSAAAGVEGGEIFLQSGKNIKCVIGINDGGVLGVYEAFKAANYLGNDIGLFGCDATNDALNAIEEGSIYRGTVSTELIKVAPDWIETAIGLVQGDESAFGKHYFNMIPVNIGNIAEYRATH